ncbi:MAG TPA: phosphatidate cytidylyltransferase [Burkholderiales bacterium]|nr:phosphatidate cytidylyltransferase [Burkholderiales bacterium]
MGAGAPPAAGALAVRVGTAAALLAGLLAALFLLPQAAFAVVVAAVLLLAGAEWARLCGLGQGVAWAYAGSVVLAYAAWAYAGRVDLAFGLSALFWIAVVPAWLGRGVGARQTPWLSLAGFPVLVPAGLAMIALRPGELLLVLGGVWIADTAAYFTGRAWGRRKLAPSISPGKTWEGAIGGVAGVLAYAAICGLLAGEVRWAILVGAAALLAVLSIYGDLFESALKRQAGRKDSGTLLPGHGGVLDRVDSATAALPLAALALPWIVGGD